MYPPLAQIADETPSFLSQTHGRSSSQVLPHSSSDFSDSLPCDDSSDVWAFVDWSMCADNVSSPKALDHHSNQDALSLPSLTSGTSEEGSPNPPASPIEDDVAGRARLRDLKKHDDALSFPQRELKPKHPDYPLQIVDPQGSGSGPFSVSELPPLLPQPHQAPALAAAHAAKTGRGKRSGPLKNRDGTADVRERGACSKCRIKRIKCDTLHLCEGCQAYHKKLPFGHLIPSGIDMCIRTLLRDIGPAFEKTPAPMPGKFSVCRENLKWNIRFHPHHMNGLSVRIQELWALPTIPMPKGPELRHIFQRPHVPTEENLVRWSQMDMGTELEGRFQNALYEFIFGCCRSRFSELEMRLLNKVHKLRCMYRIWRPRTLYYEDTADGRIYELPKYASQDLRGIARSSISSLERDLHDIFEKLSKPSSKSDNKFNGFHPATVWACLMQLILTYRDIANVMKSMQVRPFRVGFGHDQVSRTMNAKIDEIGRKASDLSKALAVECDALLLKHNSAEAPSDILSQEFENKKLPPGLLQALVGAANEQRIFFARIDEASTPLDRFLKALLSRSEPKQNKKRKIKA